MGKNAERWPQYLEKYLEFWHEVKTIESSELRGYNISKNSF